MRKPALSCCLHRGLCRAERLSTLRAVQTPLHSAPAPLPPPESPERTANLRRRPPRLQWSQADQPVPPQLDAADTTRSGGNAAWDGEAAQVAGPNTEVWTHMPGPDKFCLQGTRVPEHAAPASAHDVMRFAAASTPAHRRSDVSFSAGHRHSVRRRAALAAAAVQLRGHPAAQRWCARPLPQSIC